MIAPSYSRKVAPMRPMMPNQGVPGSLSASGPDRGRSKHEVHVVEIEDKIVHVAEHGQARGLSCALIIRAIAAL